METNSIPLPVPPIPLLQPSLGIRNAAYSTSYQLKKIGFYRKATNYVIAFLYIIYSIVSHILCKQAVQIIHNFLVCYNVTYNIYTATI